MTPTLQQELSRLEGEYQLGRRKNQWYTKYPFMSEGVRGWSVFWLPLVALVLFLDARDLRLDFSSFFVVGSAVGLVIWMICSVVINFERHEVSVSYENGNVRLICKGTRILAGTFTYWDKESIAFVKYSSSRVIINDLVRWDEIASIWYDFRLVQDMEEAREFVTTRYRLQRQDGTQLERWWTGYSAFFERMTLPRLLPALLAAYEDGQSVRFGSLSLSQAGLSYEERLLPWQECERIALEKEKAVVSIHSIHDQRGRFVRRSYERLSKRVEISQRDQERFFRRKPWARISCDEVPNLRVLDVLLQETRGTGLGEKIFSSQEPS